MPGPNVPATVIRTIINVGRGDLEGAGDSAIGLIPFGKAFKVLKKTTEKLPPVVIGENMDRVKDYAKRNSYDYYKAWKIGFSEARQTRWINDMQGQGRAIIDIGPDFTRRLDGIRPSANYNIERKLTRNYPKYRRVFKRSGKIGGVPGFD